MIMRDVVVVLFPCALLLVAVSAARAEVWDPCCSFPCEHRSVCISHGQDYTCDCTGLNYYGKNCSEPYFVQGIIDWIRPTPDTVHNLSTGYGWIWKIVNNIPFLHRFFMRYVYSSRSHLVDTPPRFNSAHEYITADVYYNSSYYARSLPAIPKNCPTQMGTKGPKKLPPAEEVVARLLRRKTFKPEPHGTNLLFASFAQHFSHQFFKTDTASPGRGSAFTYGTEGVDMSQVYGRDEHARRSLRSFKDGKMKTQTVNGEEYPPALKDAPGLYMLYPPGVPESRKVAIGHEQFSKLSWLFAVSTLWVREHNRVCDVLKKEHPSWDDERLYQTARLIIIGENIKIIVEDYVMHLSQYKFRLTFEPELTHDIDIQYSNRIRVEFDYLYRWHPFVPETLVVEDSKYNINATMFDHSSVLNHGMDKFIDSLIKQRAGAITHHNHAPVTEHIAIASIQRGRELRIQSFNNYRKRFGLDKYKTFLELTGDPDTAKEAEKIYGHVDAVEFYVGFFLERMGRSVVSATMVNIGGPYSVKGLMANPICSPGWWKPSTFGGEEGFKIVNTASIRRLVCRNLKGHCKKHTYVAFSVPSQPPWWTDANYDPEDATYTETKVTNQQSNKPEKKEL